MTFKKYSKEELKELSVIAKSALDAKTRNDAITTFATKWGRTPLAAAQKLWDITKRVKSVKKVRVIPEKRIDSIERTVIIPIKSLRIKGDNLIIEY